ncbi:MAG: YXWGXW repeat-containing protein [Gemmataceae bacterium]
MWRSSLVVGLGFVALAPAASGQAPPGAQVVQYEVLARGPVHEAFASVVDGKMAATPVVPKPPPPPLAELPPDVKPAGDDVEWVGGYWYWSDERNDFLWVSGCWREAPPDRDWLPGQWVRVADGYHWVSGVWLPEGTTRLTLLPQPPAPVEEDPGQPPAANQVFVPGTWVWQGDRYAWRPGRWVEEPAEWVWQPAQYVWTPNGYLFVDGYWDHPLTERGFLYAPIDFTAAVNRQVVYVPQYLIRPAFLEGALFVRAATKHYYFGDFFEPRYQTAGFVPWFDYRTSRVAVDPLFAHYRAYQRQADWERSVRALYAARYAGQAARPPRTWAQQQQVVRAGGHAEAARVAPLVNAPSTTINQTVNNVTNNTVQQTVQQTIQNIQNVTNLKVERVAADRQARYKEAADRRRQAAQAYQETQTQRLAQQGKAATPPKAPVGLTVPALPRATRPAPQPTPAPRPTDPTPPPVTPPKPPAGQPPAAPPPPKTTPVQPPAGRPTPPVKPAPTPPPPATAPAAPARKAPPPPPKFPAEEPPGKGKGKGKADPPGKGKGDDKKKDG